MELTHRFRCKATFSLPINGMGGLNDIHERPAPYFSDKPLAIKLLTNLTIC